jgi:hypothetical protein
MQKPKTLDFTGVFGSLFLEKSVGIIPTQYSVELRKAFIFKAFSTSRSQLFSMEFSKLNVQQKRHQEARKKKGGIASLKLFSCSAIRLGCFL